jgi:hypothetical protein
VNKSHTIASSPGANLLFGNIFSFSSFPIVVKEVMEMYFLVCGNIDHQFSVKAASQVLA